MARALVGEMNLNVGLLMGASSCQQKKEIVELLIENGVDINAPVNWEREKGSSPPMLEKLSPIQIAVGEGLNDIATLFLANGAKTHYVDNLGNTFLHAAARQNNKLIDSLLPYFKDLDVKNAGGYAASQLAEYPVPINADLINAVKYFEENARAGVEGEPSYLFDDVNLVTRLHQSHFEPYVIKHGPAFLDRLKAILEARALRAAIESGEKEPIITESSAAAVAPELAIIEPPIAIPPIQDKSSCCVLL